jgi:hypothetical protein
MISGKKTAAWLALMAALIFYTVTGCNPAKRGGYSSSTPRHEKENARDGKASAADDAAQARVIIGSAFAYCEGGLASVRKTFAEKLIVHGADSSLTTLDAPGILEMLNRDCLAETRHEIVQIAQGGAFRAKSAPGGECRATIPDGELWAEIHVIQRGSEHEPWGAADPEWYIYILRREPGGGFKISEQRLDCPE